MNGFDTSLRIELRPDFKLGWLFVGLVTITIVIVSSLPVSIWIKLGISSLLCWSLWRVLRIHVWRSHPDAIVKLCCNGDGLWDLTTRSGLRYEDLQLTTAVTGERGGLLQFASGSWQRRAVLMTTASLDKTQLRRLRVRLGR